MKTRRSFIGNAAAILMAVKASSGKAFGKGTEEPSSAWRALSLVRAVNALQVRLKAENQVGTEASHTHYWAAKEQMLRALALQAREHAADPQYGPFWRSLIPDEPTGEVIAAWTLDFFLKPDNSGYIALVLETDQSQPEAIKTVFVSDELAVIYRGTVTGDGPTAKELTHARDFPGVVPHERYASQVAQRGFIARGARFLKAAAFSVVAPLVSCPLGGSCFPTNTLCYNCCKCQKPVGCGLECSAGITCPCPSSCGAYPRAAFNCGTSDCAWCVDPVGDAASCSEVETCFSGWGPGLLCCPCR